MKGGHKFSEAEVKRFLECISGHCTSEDTPVSEVIARCYGGNKVAYLKDMLRFDPQIAAERPPIVSCRPAKRSASNRASQKAAE